ncbi:MULTISPECIES: hypothetical protein [Methylobacterium]|uniref:hypothetical protein n=1 Tax=Methylobacterium TaxID=407 RepID=UPI0012E7F6BB|nr:MULTISPECIES: hypothetical protein [Methylobacterium]MCI9879653.1 hypothetical protein [Methylobacterium goesingense]
MRRQEPAVLIVTIWGLFAVLALFGQARMPAVGSTVSALADAESPFAIIETARLERDRDTARAAPAPATSPQSAPR